ncbi:SIR2 family protein [Methanobacterium sp.]|uniref:SIR2 family protein n=1 Tax=Methanobacterium sp. TaxID=2164 RepID=UPI00315992BA
MEDKLKQDICDIVSSFTQLPYLFVGTGLSMRYSSAPSWDDLLFNAWSMMNNGGGLRYQKLKQKIEYALKDVIPDIEEDQKKYYINPQLATILQNQFNTMFYEDDDFEKKAFSEDESKLILDNKYDPFKYYISRQVESLTINTEAKDFNEIEILSKNRNKIAGIITTNYDTILEQIFSDFTVLVGQDNMLLSNTNSIFEIFKIHGSIEFPNSMVLTKEDYDYFDKKLKYLSAKLLTLFVEHPIIFIGYGMGDLNILKLLEEISICLNAQQLDKVKNNFIFITRSNDGKEFIRKKEMTFDNKRISMTELVLVDYSSFYNCLDIIESSIPVKLMRKLQDMVCKYVYSVETKNNIIFGNINSPDIEDDKAAIYVGSADTISQIGFDYFTIEDILEDIILDNRPYLINKKLIEKTFRNIRSIAGTTYLPIYKYLRKLEMSNDEIPKKYKVIVDYNNISPNQGELNYVNKEANFKTIEEIENEYPDHMIKQISNIKKYASNISAEELHKFILKHYKKDTYNSNLASFKKLIALYDFKMYSNI